MITNRRQRLFSLWAFSPFGLLRCIFS